MNPDSHPETEVCRSDARLVFGIRKGVLTHVRDVSRGLDCMCLCPYCGRTLIAKHGTERVFHFAHYEASPCLWGPETAIHLLAKDIIERNITMMLPAIPARYTDAPLRVEGMISYTNVRVEKRYHDYIPDIVVTAENHDLVIEVYVTNKVRAEKSKKIHDEKTAAIEIDVRDLRFTMDRATITSEIITGVTRKRWIYSPKAALERPPLISSRLIEASLDAQGEAKPVDANDKVSNVEVPPPYAFRSPRRLSDEKRAIIFGQAPAKCRSCGRETRAWRILFCETGECECVNC